MPLPKPSRGLQVISSKEGQEVIAGIVDRESAALEAENAARAAAKSKPAGGLQQVLSDNGGSSNYNNNLSGNTRR